jgi:hypothetical protein
VMIRSSLQESSYCTCKEIWCSVVESVLWRDYWIIPL